jgi:hypothetical protein
MEAEMHLDADDMFLIFGYISIKQVVHADDGKCLSWL